jgi:hypothetical protein
MAKATVVAREEEAAPASEPLTLAGFDRVESKRKGQGRPGINETGPPIRVRVTFDEPAEWLQEIGEAAEQVDRRVVRFTLRYDPPGEGYGMRRVVLLAGAVVGGEIVELVAEAGAVWGDGGESDQETKRRVDVWHSQLVELCGRAGLVLKGGRFGAV